MDQRWMPAIMGEVCCGAVDMAGLFCVVDLPWWFVPLAVGFGGILGWGLARRSGRRGQEAEGGVGEDGGRAGGLGNQAVSGSSKIRYGGCEEILGGSLDLVGVGVLGAGVDGRVLRMNPTAERLTGWRAADAVGQPLDLVFRVVHGSTRAPVALPIREVMEGGKTIAMSEPGLIVGRDGVERLLLESTSPLRDESRRIVGVVLVFRDLTEDHVRQRQLREREEDLALLLESSPEGIGVVNVHTGKLEKPNAQTGVILGLSKSELEQVGPVDVSPEFQPDGRPSRVASKEYLDRALQGGRPVFEWNHCRRDGQLVTCEVRLVALPEPRHHLVRFSITDITERKKTEAEARRLRENLEQLVAERTAELTEIAARLREAQRVGRMGSWQMEVATGSLEWSDEVYRIFEVDPARFVANEKAFLDLVHPEDRDTVREVYERSVRERKPYETVHRLVMPDGRIKYVLERAETVYDGEWRPVRSIGTVQDITQRREVEKALEASLRLLQSVVENAPTRFFWKDAESRYLGCNSLFAVDAGYSKPEEVIGKTDFEMAWKGQAERYRADDQLVIQTGSIKLGYEEPQSTPEGKMIWLRTSKVPLHGEGNRVIGVLGIYEDITERKLLEAQFRQAQKLEAIGQLAGGVAHDFNNILAAMMMHLGLVQMNEGLDTETREAIRELENQARRAATLTNQLLMFSRRSVLHRAFLDVNDVVSNLLKMLNRLIGEHVDLRFESGLGLPMVEADAGMLEQILVNLVVNARDAMPKGGRLTIRTSAESLSESDLTARPSRRMGTFVCLTVADTGCGMSPETVKRVFEPFFTTKEVGKGTGLGLATVHGIVAQHEGWVEVESELGLGTTFRVYLPVRPGSGADDSAAAAEDPVVQGSGERVLLVEDDNRVRLVASRALRAMGYRVYDAANGAEAMKIWQGHGSEIRLLLTDMVMPEGMTGIELAERLQAQKPELKVVISSGYSAEMVQAGVPSRAGFVYLPKPYETRTLAQAVRRCLEQKTAPAR